MKERKIQRRTVIKRKKERKGRCKDVVVGKKKDMRGGENLTLPPQNVK